MDSSVVHICRRLQSLAKVFRFVELCILLCLLSWLSTRLPFAVQISGEYSRKLITLIFNPLVNFCLGNAIVVTLLAKSGLFSGEPSPPAIDNVVAELYEELRSKNADDVTEVVVFQDKETMCEENKEPPPYTAEKSFGAVEVKTEYRRTRSEKTLRESGKKEENEMTDELRRSETDVYRKSMDEEADAMSDEEFNRTIEAFIAKQVRFHRKERLSVVLHGQA